LLFPDIPSQSVTTATPDQMMIKSATPLVPQSDQQLASGVDLLVWSSSCALSLLVLFVRGGPPPPVHQRKSPRNIASANAASGTPRFRSNSGHTLTAARVIRRPEMTARSEMGKFAQRLRAPSYAVMVEVLGTFGDNLMVPGTATNIVLVLRPARIPASRAET